MKLDLYKGTKEYGSNAYRDDNFEQAMGKLERRVCAGLLSLGAAAGIAAMFLLVKYTEKNFVYEDVYNQYHMAISDSIRADFISRNSEEQALGKISADICIKKGAQMHVNNMQPVISQRATKRADNAKSKNDKPLPMKISLGLLLASLGATMGWVVKFSFADNIIHNYVVKKRDEWLKHRKDGACKLDDAEQERLRREIEEMTNG